jgi:hypothetical protein
MAEENSAKIQVTLTFEVPSVSGIADTNRTAIEYVSEIIPLVVKEVNRLHENEAVKVKVSVSENGIVAITE